VNLSAIFTRVLHLCSSSPLNIHLWMGFHACYIVLRFYG